MTDETTLEDRIKEVLGEGGQMELGELAEALADVATYKVVKQTAFNLKKQKVICSPHRGVYALPGKVNDESKLPNGEAQSDLFKKPAVTGDDELPAGTMQVFTDKEGKIVGYLALKSEFVWLRRERISAEALEKAMKIVLAGKVDT